MAFTYRDANGLIRSAACVTDTNGADLQQIQIATISGGVSTPVPLPAALGSGGGLKIDGSGTALPISVTSLPLPAGAAQDGTDATGVAAPAGAVGIRGWLSALYSIFNTGSINVKGANAVGGAPANYPVSVSGIDTAGNKQHILLDTTGKALVNPANGAFVALTTPPAALSANLDTSLTFASPVRHLTLQNNSLTPCNVNFDAAATAGNLQLAAGQTLFLDFPCTVLHVLSTAATPVNGNAGSNLVVLGNA